LSAYEIRRIDELEAIPVTGAGITWRPIRRPFGIRAFGINAYTADEPGKHVVEEHTEGSLRHEEVYLVVEGSARFTLGEEDVDVPAGAFVYVRDPDTKRGAVALEPGTTVLAVGGKPGEAYEPSAWEWWFAAAPYRDRGDWEGALAVVAEGLEHKPDNPFLLYNVACYEALADRRDDAMKTLARAIELEPKLKEWARSDEDFAGVADDPAFRELVA
jgi:tetratricopeptide (TPR) repeat protein